MIGHTLAVKYEVLAQVSDGPIFTMFSARDRLSGRNVGIRQVKMPFNVEQDFIQSLVGLLPGIQVHHPNVEAIYEVVEDSGQHYVISEMPKGSQLGERIKRFAPFTVPVSLATVIGIVEGLDGVHMSGIAHGDIGPHNIIATHDGSAKLQLPGVWRAYSSSRTAGVAVLSQMAPYLAPEVCTGQKPSITSDLYSVGVILFELLTGRLPFAGESPTATTVRHLTSPVPSIRGINASVPSAVEQVVQRLLAKSPDQRYQSAKELLTELRAITDQLRFGRVPVTKTPTVGDSLIVEPAKPIREVKKQEKPKPTKEEVEERRKQRRQERDVPTWFLAILGLLFLVVVGLVVCFLMYLAQKPRDIKVPNLKGIMTQKAIEQVKPLKLTIRVASKEANERIDIGKILRTSPEAGSMIREGGTISVVESSGTRMVKVPDLAGMTADEAKVALQAENLKVEGKPSRITDFEHAAGTIIKQLPDANEVIPRMSNIRIWIAATPDSPVGSLPGESDVEATDPAHSFQLDYTVKKVKWSVTVRIEIEDKDGLRNVMSKDCEAGDVLHVSQVGHGDSAVFKVYFDNELKDTITVKPGVKTKN